MKHAHFYSNLFLSVSLTLFLEDSKASMRCTGGIIDEGDMTFEVIRKCGPPTERQITAPSLDPNGHVIKGAVSVERWVYGPSNGMYQNLRFIDAKLVEIRSKKQ